MKFIFFTKKLVEILLMPLQFSLLLLVCGVVLLWLNRGRRLPVYLVTAGTCLLLIFSNSYVGYQMVHQLEAQYPPFRVAGAGAEVGSRAQVQLAAVQADTGSPALGQKPAAVLGQSPFIAVLSGGASNDPSLPTSDRLNPHSALRVVEAVQIYRSLTCSTPTAANTSQSQAKEKNIATVTPRLLISGGPTLNSVPEAIPMQQLAGSLGIPASAISLEIRSDDTANEAKEMLKVVGYKPFILVTSAYHMPRAVALFRHLGMRPVPAPANYLGQRSTEPFVLKLPPSSSALVESETAWHEDLGMIWEDLRGQL